MGGGGGYRRLEKFCRSDGGGGTQAGLFAARFVELVADLDPRGESVTQLALGFARWAQSSRE